MSVAPPRCHRPPAVYGGVTQCYVAKSDMALGRALIESPTRDDGCDGMAAAQGDPPAVARQRVRRALRRFRDATPLSQGDVARKLGWSLSKMQRIEGGEVGISITDLRALLDLYSVTDTEMVESLIRDAVSSRRQRYEIPQEHRKHLTVALRELIQFEKQASSIRTYQPNTYPGVLQTSVAAEAILSWWSDDNENRRIRHAARMSRKQDIIEPAAGPDYYLILDESVIKRQISDDWTTAEQLEYLASASRRQRIHVRIVPLAKGAFMGVLGPFQVVQIGGEDGDSLLYREYFDRDEITHDLEAVKFHRDAFEQLWRISLSEEATLSLIVAEAARLRALLHQAE